MSKKIAWIFPGQGAQVPGMGKDFAEAFPIAKETFEEADEILGEKLSSIIFEGPQELLTQTRYSQLGIFVTSVALLRVLRQQMPELQPTVCAGLSLGEYTALYASGRISFEEGLRLVQKRAHLMHEACEKAQGKMAAVLGMGDEEVEGALREVEGIWVANYNTPGQIVISGTEKGLERATALLKERGAKRILPLAVHGAFHSGLMHSAQEGLVPWVQKVSLKESEIGFVMNVPGARVEKGEEIRENLVRQVTSPVRWHQGIRAMGEIDLYIEIGPGKTLTGMNRKLGLQGVSLEKVEDLDQLAGVICNC